MPSKTSTESGIHPYMKVGFLTDSKNHFWEEPGRFQVCEKSSHVDHIMEWSPKAKEYYRESARRMLAERSRYKLHALKK